MGGQHLQGWQERQIAKQIVAGEKSIDIAEEWDISINTIANVKKRQRELIESESARYLESLPDCVKIQQSLIAEVKADMDAPAYELDSDGEKILDENGVPIRRNRLDKTNPELFKAGCKAAEKVMQGVGLQPSQSISLNIQQIYNDNSKTIIAPVVLSLLADLNTPAEDDE